MVERELKLPLADGVLPVFLTRPEFVGPYPLVVLLMDAPGIRPELYAMARRLATAGYAVALPNLYHRTMVPAAIGAAGWPLPVALDPDSPRYREVIYRHMAAVTAQTVAADVAVLLQAVTDDPCVSSRRLGVVGYCMSGPFAVTLAATLPDRVVAAASIHGVRLCHAGARSAHLRLPAVRAELYFACAAEDDWAPPPVIAALEACLKANLCSYRLDWYPATEHGFVFPDRGERYVEAAAERHWAALHDLLRRRLYPSSCQDRLS